jgi:hypothetical protein
LVVDLDGLLQRFGRRVPDAVGLVARAVNLRAWRATAASGSTLDISVVRFRDRGNEEQGRAELMQDWARLGLADEVREFGLEPLLLDGSAALQRMAAAGSGVMLMSGRHAPVSDALASGIPAYVVSDRRQRSPEQLPVVDAERVLAESIRLPTPRPVAADSRSGSVLAIPISDVADARRHAEAAIREDARADWIVLGDHLLLYTENDESARRLTETEQARQLRVEVKTRLLSVVPPGADAPSHPLFSRDGYALIIDDGDGSERMGWNEARRRVFGSHRQMRSWLPGRTTSSVDNWTDAGLQNFADGTAGQMLTQLRAVLPAMAAPDVLPAKSSIVSFTSPYGHDQTEDLVAVMYGPAAPDTALPADVVYAADARMAVSAARTLVQRRRSPGVLHCLAATVPVPDVLGQLLWGGERNRLVVTIRLERTTETAAPASASPGLMERLRPVFPSLVVDPDDSGPPVLTLRSPGPSDGAPPQRDVDAVDAAIAALTG